MTSRISLIPQAVRARESLLDALRKPGDHTELIAQRARKLLGWTPSGTDRNAWLQQVLPEQWHVDKTVTALGAVHGNGNTSNGATPAASSKQGNSSGQETVTSRGQGQRQRRRHARR